MLRRGLLYQSMILLFAGPWAWAQGPGTVVYHESFDPDAHPLYVFGGVIRFGPRQGDPYTHAFVALVRTGAGDYVIYVLDGEGYRAIATGTSADLVEGVPAVLAIVPEGGGLGLYVAGERVLERPPANGVGIGIVAAGTGRFRFDDFVLERP